MDQTIIVGKSLFKSKGCWICEGWVEIEIEVTCKASTLNCKIHLDIDKYADEYMENPYGQTFCISRAVPVGGVILFYFSDDSGEVFVNEKYKKTVSYEKGSVLNYIEVVKNDGNMLVDKDFQILA